SLHKGDCPEMRSPIFLLVHLCLIIPGIASAQTHQTSLNDSASANQEMAVRMFYATAGWDANRVRSAFGTGTVSRGGDTEHFEVEIDRASGQVRTHLLSSNLTMIAGPNGGYVVRPDGSR